MFSFSKDYIAFSLALAALVVLLGIVGCREGYNASAISTNGTIDAFDGSTVTVKYLDTNGIEHILRTTQWKGIDKTKPVTVLYGALYRNSARLKASNYMAL